MAGIDIRLSGAVEARVDDVPAPLPGRRVRALLAMLAVQSGRAVPAEVLLDGIFGDSLPQGGKAALQVSVSRLRAALGTEVVRHEAGGYRLDVPRDRVDLLVLEDAVRDRGEDAELLRAALGAWRGAPFGESLSDHLDQHEAPRWVELRLTAVERLAALDLAAGRLRGWVTQLGDLVAEHPLRESCWALLLRALRASGRQAEALERYAELQRLLADELGTDPSPALQRLHAELLRGREEGERGEPEPAPAVPRQLPLALGRFVGRLAELTELDRHLASGGPALVTGPGGSGKSTLALEWASARADRFPDGQLFVDLGGPDSPLFPGVALGQLLRGLGVPGDRIADDVPGRRSLLRQEVAGRRLVLVLDDARDAEQVRDLLLPPPATVLVTSRDRMAALVARDGVPRVDLGPMSDDDATALLASRISVGADDKESLRELAELCDRLPLALALAAERATDGADSLTEVLRDERERLDVLSAEPESGLSVRAVLEWSYGRLDPACARLFRFLALDHHGEMGPAEAAAMTGVRRGEARLLLDRIAERNLLTREGAHYRMHDLTRLFAREKLREDPERPVAVDRLIAWAVHSAHAARTALLPPRGEVPLRPVPEGVVPEEFADGKTAYAWLTSHYRRLAVLVEHAPDDVVVELAPSLATYLSLLGAHAEQLSLCEYSFAAAERLGDPRRIGVSALQVGNVLNRSGRYAEAQGWYERAQRLLEAAGAVDEAVTAQSNVGIALMYQPGRLEEAVRALEAAHRRREEDDPTILNNLGVAYADLGRLDEAVDAAERATARFGVQANPVGEAHALDTLAMALSYRGDWQGACTALVGAAEIYRAVTDRRGEVETLTTLGVVQQRAGWDDDAAETWRNALRLVGSAPSLESARDQLLALLAERELPAQREAADDEARPWPTFVVR